MKLLLIRHGETYFNNAGRIQGWMDPGLNERGHQQARDLVEHLPADGDFSLVSSPLRRARQTAETIREELDIERFEIIDPFRELNQGHWNGLRSETAKKVDAERFQKWMDNPLSAHPPEGESLDQLRDRVRSGLKQLLDDFQSPVLVVAHKVVNSMLMHLAGECEYESVMDSLPENAALFELDVSSEDLAVSS